MRIRIIEIYLTVGWPFSRFSTSCNPVDGAFFENCQAFEAKEINLRQEEC